MDRNLGASRVALSHDDSEAYGDLFQWGRLDDGHQTRTSGTTATLSSTDNPGHSNFILNSSSPYDWRSPENNNLWQGVSGTNNPCPSGWRVATYTEWETELATWNELNYNGAYASLLKLPASGYRFCINGDVYSAGTVAYQWTSTANSLDSKYLFAGSSSASVGDIERASAAPVRCIQD
jgi:uncharacterized protein (TIGR02145 family)